LNDKSSAGEEKEKEKVCARMGGNGLRESHARILCLGDKIGTILDGRSSRNDCCQVLKEANRRIIRRSKPDGIFGQPGSRYSIGGSLAGISRILMMTGTLTVLSDQDNQSKNRLHLTCSTIYKYAEGAATKSG
jgi:hypothetical protein